MGGYTAVELGRLAALASVADQTPEGKSILDLFQRMPPVAANGPAAGFAGEPRAGPAGANLWSSPPKLV